MTKELEQKARQLLEIEQVKKLYDKLMDINQEKAIAPVMMLKIIILNFGSNREFRAIEKDYNDLLQDLPDIGEEKPKYNLQNPEELEQFKKRVEEYTKQAEKLNSIVERSFDLALQLQRQDKLIITWPEGLKPEVMQDYIATANTQHFYNTRQALSRGIFEKREDWPEADISGGTVKQGRAILKPAQVSPIDEEDKTPAYAEFQEVVKEQAIALSKQGPLAADIFDIITAKFAQHASGPNDDPIWFSADDFLEARGLKKMLTKEGKRTGYKNIWRLEIQKQIAILDTLWIDVAEMEIHKGNTVKTLQGRAIDLQMREVQKQIFGGEDVFKWFISPGYIFRKYLFSGDISRQTALLSKKILQFDYDKQAIEKDIGRYLTYIWRIDENKKRLRVNNLLSKGNLEINVSRPKRTLEKFERALNTLQESGVISAWEYEEGQALTSGRGWCRKWKEQIVVITAPEELIEHYKTIRENKQKEIEANKKKGRKG